jgi:enoyl-CoA hydratase/carnithine racemase
MGQCVNVQVTDGVATIRMDRPPMNAISVQVQAELRAAAATVSATSAIRAAVVYGGEKVGMHSFVENGPGKARFVGR